MADATSIEWTEATWNPVTGCTKISSGCDNCYAERFSERFRGVPGHPFESGFDLTLRPARLEQPLAWRRPRMIFVNSMSDLFHKDVPDAFIDRGLRHDGAGGLAHVPDTDKAQLADAGLTSTPLRSRPVPAHIWLGVSVEDGTKSRVRHLRETNAAVRFLSIEPLIGPSATRPDGHCTGSSSGARAVPAPAHGEGWVGDDPRPVPARRRAVLLQAVGWLSGPKRRT